MLRALLLVLTLAVAWPAQAQPTRVVRQFEAGNRYYAGGDYRAALRAYAEVQQRGYASGALYANVGGAHLRLGQLGQAIRYLEKARRLRPEGERLRRRLGAARRQAGPEVAQATRPRPAPWIAAGRALAGWAAPALYLGLGLLLYLAALGAWAVALRTGTNRRPRLRLAAGLLGLLLTGAALWASAAETADPRAVVVAPASVLRTAPALGADSVRALPEGLPLRLRHRRDEWTRVALPDGTTGWLRTTALGTV